MFYLGTISCTGTSGYTNQRTGASGSLPFAIPRMQRLYLSPDTAGMRWALGAQSGFNASGLAMAPLGAADSLQGPFTVNGDPNGTPVVSVVALVSGSVRVFAGPRQ